MYPETTVVRVAPRPQGGYTLETVRSGAWRPKRTRRVFTADQVVFAAGTRGTQHQLHRLKRDGALPHISEHLGVLTRTNSEALAGAIVKLRNRKRYDFTAGVAITSSFHPDKNTHIEPVRRLLTALRATCHLVNTPTHASTTRDRPASAS